MLTTLRLPGTEPGSPARAAGYAVRPADAPPAGQGPAPSPLPVPAARRPAAVVRGEPARRELLRAPPREPVSTKILAESTSGPALIPPAAGPRRPVEQRGALGQGHCARSACGRPFQRRRSGGRAQRFCTPRCRRLADAEFRRAVRVPVQSPERSLKPRVGGRSVEYWRSGIDVATRRRVPVAGRPPWAMAENSAAGGAA